MQNISHNLSQIRQELTNAAHECGRQANEILLLAVSKTKPNSAIIAAYQAGQRDFGENYAQELADKARALDHLAITWHFIGPLQSNKTKLVAEYADWVHSIDRLKIAQRLNDQRPSHKAPLQVCIQVNVDNEPTKSGILPYQLPELVRQIHLLPNLTLRGLMTIPSQEDPKAAFEQLSDLACSQGLNTLSMGMSNDMNIAISAGSTIIRIGTAIFGPREYSTNKPVANDNTDDQQ